MNAPLSLSLYYSGECTALSLSIYTTQMNAPLSIYIYYSGECTSLSIYI